VVETTPVNEPEESKRKLVLSALWFPAAFVAAATYLARSPEPLNVRIAGILIAAGLAMVCYALTPAALVRAKDNAVHRLGLARFIPSLLGVGVLLVLVGELLLFPSDEIAICAAAWIVFEQVWRRIGIGGSASKHSEPPKAEPIQVAATAP
jgi:hypothetical protein